MHPARYLLVLVTTCLLALGVAGSFAWMVDPADRFKPARFDRDVAAALARGRYIVNLPNVDWRRVKTLLIQDFAPQRAVAALGSSRVMQLRAAHVGQPFPDGYFNFAYANAQLNDLVHTYAMLRAHDALPDRLVVAVDPWLLNRAGQADSWRPRAEASRPLLRELGLGDAPVFRTPWDEPLDALAEVLALPTQRAAWAQWSRMPPEARSTRLRRFDIRFDGGADNEDFDAPVTRPDGSFRYARSHRETSVEAGTAAATAFASAASIHRLDDFERLDPTLRTAFEAWLVIAAEDGVQIELFIPPYHPAAWSLLRERPEGRMALAVEDWARTLAAHRRLPLRGGLDPTPLGCTAADFFDAMHPRESCIARIWDGDVD